MNIHFNLEAKLPLAIIWPLANHFGCVKALTSHEWVLTQFPGKGLTILPIILYILKT